MYIYTRLKKVVFLILGMALLGSILMMNQASAQDDLFVVRNIPLNRVADNAVQAQNLAIREGQRLAFDTLAERLLLDSDQSVLLGEVSDEQIDTLISDFETQQEQFSDRRYRALLTVRFKQDRVKQLLSQEKTGKLVELRSTPVLVLPFVTDQNENVTHLWSRDNLWLKIWQTMIDATQLVPVVLPKGDIQDAALADEAQILSGDIAATSLLQTQYQVDRVVVVEGAQSEDGFILKIYEYIGDSLSEVKHITRSVEGDESYKWAIAVQSVQKYLNEEWKRQLRYSTKANLKHHAVLNVKFESARDWIRLKKIIEDNPYTGEIHVRRLKRDHAEVETVFSGGIDDIQSSFALDQIIIRKAIETASGFSQSGSSLGGAGQTSYYQVYAGSDHAVPGQGVFDPQNTHSQGYETQAHDVLRDVDQSFENYPSLYIESFQNPVKDGRYETQ